ncbi:VanZ family protein [Saccharothrix tamanrassetensis]|uniref:VanZ family protein n=1 Tax=Saccharothrix tamanrassetensis TaxID=1051531 RepID=A0A841CFQ6_9PSEU|nr:VanZ family protein [Saccharothrix tamanrassetensis]MBB5955813.1 VanZ family protein [Saccharothrix tamanrassetensis]
MSRRILPFVTAVLLSVIVLFMPQSGVPDSPPGTDKVVHVLLFALLAVTGLVARLPRNALLAALVAYAAVSEVLQWLIVALGRGGDVVDGLVDVLGIALGWLVARLAFSGGSRLR